MAVSLPPSLAGGLREIAALPQSSFDALLAFLRGIPVQIKQYRVFNSPIFTSADLGDKGQSITEAAFSLILSRAARRIAITQFVDDLIEGFTPSRDLDDVQLRNLRIRATDILSVDALDLVARAHNVLLEHSQVYTTARIVTDIRPVFGEDVLVKPLSNVIVHMLSIVYRSAGRRENFVVALDEKDLDQLIDVLERAKTKERTLKELMKNNNIPSIEVV